MAEPVGDLVVDLSLDAARFDEQMARVRRHFSGTESDAKKTAAVVEQSMNRQALAAQKGAIPGSYSAVIDMPSGRGSVTLEFKIFQKGNQGAGNITDCTVIVTKKAASGISIR